MQPSKRRPTQRVKIEKRALCATLQGLKNAPGLWKPSCKCVSRSCLSAEGGGWESYFPLTPFDTLNYLLTYLPPLLRNRH